MVVNHQVKLTKVIANLRMLSIWNSNYINKGSMYAHIARYKKVGYQATPTNNSMLGAEVFFHPVHNKVVKFGQDPAYDLFVKHAIASPSSAFPEFFLHDTPAGPFTPSSNAPYTVTEMEFLLELTPVEGQQAVDWFQQVIGAMKNAGHPHSVADPFNLTNALVDLCTAASSANLCIDLGKSSNFMVRSRNGRRVVVITDPFN